MDDVLTPNAVIAWNVRRLRRQRGWTQTDLAERLTERDTKPWTCSMVSDAETAGRTDRDRQFTINEVNVLARVFQVSVVALFVPDPAQLVRIGNSRYTRNDYVDLVLQFPPGAMPEGFERSLQNQYAVRNRDNTDRLARSRPLRHRDPLGEAPRSVAAGLPAPSASGDTLQYRVGRRDDAEAPRFPCVSRLFHGMGT